VLGYADYLPWEDQARISNLWIDREDSINGGAKALGDEEQCIPWYYGISKCSCWTNGWRWWTRARYADYLPWENQVGISNLWIDREDSINGGAKALCYQEQCIPWYYGISKCSCWTNGWRWWTRAWYADYLPWENQVGISNLGVDCEDSINGGAKALGDEKEGVPWYHGVSKGA